MKSFLVIQGVQYKIYWIQGGGGESRQRQLDEHSDIVYLACRILNAFA